MGILPMLADLASGEFGFDAPKGQDSIAQGNALGLGLKQERALKGRNQPGFAPSGLGLFGSNSQGCTLGYRMSPHWGEAR
jgi:hypothetical protein